MAMFDENFSFDTARSPSLVSSTGATRDSSRSVSPCTTSAPFPSPRFSVADLAVQFASQRIERDSQICYDSCASYANTDDDADWSIPPPVVDDDDNNNTLRRSQTFPQRSHSPSRRSQRQINTRLLCTTSHRRDVAALVTRMIEAEEQCCIIQADPLIASPDDIEDEGYNSSDDALPPAASRRCSIVTVQCGQQYQGISERGSGNAGVEKRVRVRKENRQRRRKPSRRE